jgi:penicillin-binding protein 2
MRKKDLFLEEAVLDDLSQNFDSLEQPLSARAFKLIGFFAAIIIAVVVGRLFFLGWFKNDFYKSRALANSGRIAIVRTQRGIIFDKFNKPLVKNLPAYRLNLKLVEFFKNEEERIRTINALQNILNLSGGELENMLKEVNLEKQNSLTIAKKLNIDQLIKIKNLNLPALQVDDYFEREYSDPLAFSHLIGYTGIASNSDLENNPSLSLNDIVGKSGLEVYYDKELRGEEGETINYKNVKGEIIDEKLVREPMPGYELYTTIDAEFQSYFYSRLKQGIDYLGSRGGVGIALNPQNGEVLALFNLPSFDNNEIKQADLTNQFRPLFNRAISGIYVPGSTVKPLVAFAALKENIIEPEKEIYSAGYIEIPNPYHPDQPSRFVDWKPHGRVNLYSAIARSSNVYFYEVGGGFGNQKGLGIEKLKEYWQKFGFGELTGIDLAGEAKGFLPAPNTKEKKGEIWRLGDTYNVSIGQGDFLATPLQLINYIAAIANGGKIYQPFIAKKIISEKGEVIKETNSKIIKDYSSDIEIIRKIQKGMIDGVEKSYGTSHLLADLPVSAAGKTGSSQIENKKKINAFFVGYAPTDSPQIAILILVEDAREGSVNAVPIAKDVLKWYYNNRIIKSF